MRLFFPILISILVTLNAKAEISCRGAYNNGRDFDDGGPIFTSLGNLTFNQTVAIPQAGREVLLTLADKTLELSLTDGKSVLGISRVENNQIHSTKTKLDVVVVIGGRFETVEVYCE